MKQFLLVAAISVTGFYFICTQMRAGLSEEPIRAFYVWANEKYGVTTAEEQTLDTLSVRKLYVKFFEVERSESLGIIPVAKTSMVATPGFVGDLDSTEIVPTVFIRNEIFKNSTQNELQELADNIAFLVDKYFSERFGHLEAYRELQIDCDWTEGTRDQYFQLLTLIKQKISVKLSATLRLYAYKFPERMGVLPVDRAMLMCYNLLSPRQAGDRNSILDLEELDKYLTGAKSYPRPLDVALPVYSMLQIYQNQQLAGIHYNETKAQLSQLKNISGHWNELKTDQLLGETYARAGDRIKYEQISPKVMEKAIELILHRVEFKDRPTVSLFHLDDTELEQYNYEELDHFYRAFYP